MCFSPFQVYYYIVDSPRNEGKEFFEINLQSGEIFTKTVFDREKKGAYALEVEARDGAPSARPNSNGPNSGEQYKLNIFGAIFYIRKPKKFKMRSLLTVTVRWAVKNVS